MSGVQLHLLWEGTQLADHSYARVNRAHCLNLARVPELELSLVPYEPNQFEPQPGSPLEALMAHDIRRKGLNLRERKLRPHVWLRHTWPPKPKPPGRDPWVVMLPWEYSLLPVKHVQTIAGASAIFTPSHFSAHALRRSGVTAPVHVVPNGVDVDTFQPDGERASFDRFCFLYVGGTIFRKGIDLLLEAYARAYSDRDDVLLVIKDFGTGGLYQGQTAGEMIRAFAERPGAPAVRYIDEHYPNDQLARLYRGADVLVSPYRGEGFSLPTLEAMACGTPVIVTEGGATDDFVDHHSGWHIPARPLSVGHSIYGDALPDEGFLLEPDVAELAERLRYASDHPAEVQRRGRHAAEAGAKWHWQAATRQLLEQLDALVGTRLAGGTVANTQELGS